MGIYALSAFSTVLDRFFNGKSSKAEYIKNPFLSEKEDDRGEKEEMTEEKRKEMENKKLALTLQAMQANFEINKKRKIKEDLCNKE